MASNIHVLVTIVVLICGSSGTESKKSTRQGDIELSSAPATSSASPPAASNNEIESIVSVLNLNSSSGTLITGTSTGTGTSTSDTEITFWTPIITYWEKVPNMIMSKIPTNFPVSLNTVFMANIVSMALVAASTFISYFFSPNTLKLFTKLTESITNFTWQPNVEELARKVNLAVESYNKLDPEICLRMASCTLYKEKKKNQELKNSSSSSPKHPHPILMGIQILDNVLRYMSPERYTTVSRSLKNGRDFADSGGDCDTFNRKRQCPLDAQTWQLLLSSLSSVIYQVYQ